MNLRRFIPVVMVAVLLAGILVDPYTSARDGSDAIRRIPLWQLSFALLDIGFLFAFVALIIRDKSRGAFVLAIAETVYYLAGNALLYLRDGPDRFAHGLGGESNLGQHVTVVALRIALIVYLGFISRSRALGRLTRA